MKTTGPPRRAFFRAFAAFGALTLAGCERLSNTDWFPKVLGAGETASKGVAHLVTSRKAMAQEFGEADLSPAFRSNGTAEPNSDAYRALLANGFADYRLEIGGLVERPGSMSLAELKALPSRTQITRHDCVEGWSAIGKWKGAKLSALLEAARPKPEARYVVFHCADPMGERRHRSLLREHRFRRRVPSADDPRLRVERRAAPGQERRPGAVARRAAAWVQARQVRDACRGGRKLRAHRRRQRRLLGGPRLPVVRGDLIRSPVVRVRRTGSSGDPPSRSEAAWQASARGLSCGAVALHWCNRAVTACCWRLSGRLCRRQAMLTIEELSSIPLFAALPAVELEHLAKRAADVHLAAGEYAVHEGEDRALFAVLAGKIEVTKHFDGIERTIGWRTRGKIFGEVPLALGGRLHRRLSRSGTLARRCASTPRQYYALAAASPGDRAEGRRARARAHRRAPGHRCRDAQGAGDDGRTPAGTSHATICGDSSTRNQITFEWMTPDAPELPARWPEPRARAPRNVRRCGSPTAR